MSLTSLSIPSSASAPARGAPQRGGAAGRRGPSVRIRVDGKKVGHAMKRYSTAALACLAIGSSFPAAAMTVVLDGAMQTYRAPDGSRNYSEPSSAWGSYYSVVGIETDPQSLEFNGRFAATVEFNLGALPTDAIITGAYLTLSPFFHNDSIDTLSSYVAGSIAVDPTRARGGNLITAFDVDDIYTNPRLSVTSAVKASLGGVASHPILGFAFEQVVDRCGTPRDNDCISSLGQGYPGDPGALRLTMSYDVPAPPPPSPTAPVPEPATWAMFLGGFALIGAAMRRRQVGVNLRLGSR